MQIHFNKIRDFVYEVNLDLPCSYEELQEDFAEETWVADSAAYGQSQLVDRYYLEWDQLKSPRLQLIQDWAGSDEFRRTAIDQLYSEELFAGHWGIDSEKLFQSSKSFGRILRDRPGYHCGLHLDNRLLVATGMIYFADHDHADISTEFYTDKTRRDPARITTGFGWGWIAANMHDSWHDGWNRSQHDRYSMILGISLNI
jgi:hypothetical protein